MIMIQTGLVCSANVVFNDSRFASASGQSPYWFEGLCSQWVHESDEKKLYIVSPFRCAITYIPAGGQKQGAVGFMSDQKALIQIEIIDFCPWVDPHSGDYRAHIKMRIVTI